jgi:hypothetical protein
VTTAVITLAAALAGYAASIVQQLLTETRTDARETRRRAEDRQNHRAEFQRATLLELQETLHDLGRAAAQIAHADMMEHRRTGAPIGRNLLGDELGEGARLAHPRVAILVLRVSDDAVRESVTRVTELSAHFALERIEAEDTALRLQLVDANETANQAIRRALAATFLDASRLTLRVTSVVMALERPRRVELRHLTRDTTPRAPAR